MDVRPRSGTARPRYRFVRRLLAGVLRWAFIAIGAATAAAVLFTHLYSVNESIYDPSLFAIGVGGLFSMGCGVMLAMVSRSSRLRMELRNARARCEELADGTWGLREAEARATSLLEAQGDLIVRRDNDGRVSYANDAFCALAGAPREALIGNVSTLAVAEQGPTFVLPDGTRVHDQKIISADGPRWLAWREVVVWSAAGDRAEVQSVGRDVTDRTETGRALAHARDAAEAASLAKSRFLAVVSHEIRTPLNGILGMTDLLLDTPLTPEQAAYVKAAKTSGDALLALIEDILDFSKIEAGKLDLDPRPFKLAALVEEVVELLGPRAQAKGLEIASYVDDRLPDEVVGDATRLRQVLLNLAGNAIKFTERGSVGVIVEPAADEGRIVFQVRDTGIGIAAEEQARIFLEFEQAQGGSTRQFGGTGLGLAISRRIVERMGGAIAVDSAPGGGANFRAMVPLPPAAARADAHPASPDLSGKTVLVAAPPSLQASLLARRLTQWGADVAVADEPFVARHIAERHFDIVLLDHTVGADAAVAIVHSIGDAVAQRIVLITPSERHRLPALKAAGFTGYLVKPMRAVSLAARLASAEAFEPGAAAIAASPERLPSGDRAAQPQPLSILIAEDNEINALLACALIGKLGHRATLAVDGGAAVEAWQAAAGNGAGYDIVLMDVQMPGVDGLEATRRIRDWEAKLDRRRTPIVALTANAFAEDRDACLAAGMDGFLVKPLDRERLAATLSALSRRAALAA